MELKVSVIVAVYNTEAFLPFCLDSIINQTLKELEIIIVNDGSTDNSAQIIRDYATKDKRIKIFEQANKGISNSHNRALSEAKGEFVGFVDSDDAISENMFETMYNTGKEYDTDIVISGYKRCDEKMNVIRDYYPPIEYNKVYSGNEKIHLIEESHRNNLLLYAWRNIFKRKMIMENNILYDKETKVGNEILFNLNALYAAKNLVALKKAFYFYRNNPYSVSQSRYKPHLENSLKVQYKKQMEFYREHELSDFFAKELYKKACFHFMPMLLSNIFALRTTQKDSYAEIIRISKLPMFKESFKNIPIFNLNLPAGKQFIIMTSKLRMYRLLWLFYAHKKKPSVKKGEKYA